MAIIKCPECEKEFEDSLERCPVCGCLNNSNLPKEQVEKQIKNVEKFRNIRKIFGILCALSLVFSIIFFYRAYDVKNNYYNSEYTYSLNSNAYVGGDAYNYIINGTYFTGYAVIASAGLICMTLFGSGVLYSTIKINEQDDKDK